jgi:hypothetical protein
MGAALHELDAPGFAEFGNRRSKVWSGIHKVIDHVISMANARFNTRFNAWF